MKCMKVLTNNPGIKCLLGLTMTMTMTPQDEWVENGTKTFHTCLRGTPWSTASAVTPEGSQEKEHSTWYSMVSRGPPAFYVLRERRRTSKQYKPKGASNDTLQVPSKKYVV
jgi:hypothetical protein